MESGESVNDSPLSLFLPGFTSRYAMEGLKVEEVLPGKFLLSDQGTPQERGNDYVLGASNASLTLASLTPRTHFNRALDLGAGSGIQSLFLATHVDEIVATDTNARALELAHRSAQISDVHLDLRQGSLYEPVAGEQFDLIVCNPPFVIAPSALFEYRDAGMDGDSVSREIVSNAAEFLNEDGWFICLANWLIKDDWRDRLIEWIAPTGCDAWVVQRERLSAEEYVNLWLDDGGVTDRAAIKRRWLEYLAPFDGVGFGWVALHKRDSFFPHRYLEEIPQQLDLLDIPLAPALLEYFAGADLAHDLEDEEILERSWVAHPEVIAAGHTLVQTSGLRRAVALDPEVVARYPEPGFVSEVSATYEGGIDVIRELIRLGLLLPA
ncbi:MAG: methyltransferase [Actinobacteria bacterium]|uniref:Unannotated protein n=1 Tax=freshwater metagenome TaxID=449393 RepID=A0A6J6NP32_9ZZZZ|nr:methyltransferase [Actinomycetota bacterium]MSY88333.1 methyltransferase [Actinomycetota bacterium]